MAESRSGLDGTQCVCECADPLPVDGTRPGGRSFRSCRRMSDNMPYVKFVYHCKRLAPHYLRHTLALPCTYHVVEAAVSPL